MNILVIPDIQAKPGHKFRHLKSLAKFIDAKRPDGIVCLGDLWDMPSLSYYDEGKKASEGRRLHLDVNAGMVAANLITPNIRGYDPDLLFVEGNHENRIKRYENDNPKLEGSLFSPVRYMTDIGWKAHKFLEVAKMGGIMFSHFFPRTLKGTTTAGSQRNGANSAEYMVRANMASCIAGHKQGLDTHIHSLGDRRLRGIIAGSFYEHDESYHSPQGNKYWRGVLMLNNVKNGDFDLTEVSLDYLRKTYK